MRLVTFALLALLALTCAAPAAAQEPPNTKKERVEHVGFLAEPQVISTRFRDGLMYVSTLRGLSIYDIKNPAKPAKLGELRLPHFENEDIDVGDGIALISNDPSEGAGRLYVIDVRDPRNPKQLSELDTGTADAGIITGSLGSPFGIGHGTGHTASCVQDCKFVYLAGTASGIDVVDLRDPANPKYATPANFPVPEATGGLATHDVQFDRAGRAWIAGAGGTAAYDVTNPLSPVLVARTDEQGQSRYAKTFGNDDGSTYNDFIHHNSMRLPNSSLRALPIGADPAADSNVVAVTEEDYNRPTCRGAGSFQTWEISRTDTRGGGEDGKGAPVPALRALDKWEVEIDPSRSSLCSAHYFDDRGGLVAQGWYEQGVRFLDVSDPRDIRQVGFFIPQKNMTWGAVFPPTDPTGEIVYGLDNLRGIDVLRFDRPDPVVPGGASRPEDLGSLPTVVAPPADGPGASKAEVPGRARSGRRPDVALRISDGRRTARRGQTLRWRVEVRHRAGEEARNLFTRIDLPRSVTRVRTRGATLRGRRLTYRLGRLAPGKRRTYTITATVKRRTKARAVLLIGALLTGDDANPRDNRARDRNPLLRRPRRSRAASIAALAGTERAAVTPAERRRAEADHRLARRNASLTSRNGPRLSPSTVRVVRSAFGYVCRF